MQQTLRYCRLWLGSSFVSTSSTTRRLSQRCACRRVKIFRYHPTLCVKRWRSNQVSLPSQILRLLHICTMGKSTILAYSRIIRDLLTDDAPRFHSFPNWPRYPRYIHRNTRQRSSRSSFWLRCQRSNPVAPQPLESPAAVALIPNM